MSVRKLHTISVFICLAPASSFAQDARGAARPSFEVASVKPSGGDGRIYQMNSSDPGRISWKNFSLPELLKRAYGIKAYQIAGPGWFESQGYDIMATLPSGAGADQLPAMLQTLLADRFKLAFHFENREMPVLGLTAAKDGLKIHQSPPANPETDGAATPSAPAQRPKPQLAPDGYPNLSLPGGGKMGMVILGNRARGNFRKESMQQLVDFLTGETGHPVIDMTGLKGSYDFTLYWVSERAGIRPPEGDASEPGPNIYGALQQQAGLKLEQRKHPVRVLVIDRVEKVPTAN
jgi:uncharacterized protein (TIGR03435 family)